jgi:hypothetical protein
MDETMAVLPSEKYLIQQVGNNVILYERYTEEEVVIFPVNDRDAIAKAQKTIHDDLGLSQEDKTFAHFWSGYFYGIASWVEKDGYSMRAPSVVQLSDLDEQPNREPSAQQEKDWDQQYDGTSFGA